MNTNTNDGGPAFPCNDHNGCAFAGMTLRDWFAGMAMQGMLIGSSNPMFDDNGKNVGQATETVHDIIVNGPGSPDAADTNNSPCAIFSWASYGIADAMLSARNGRGEG
jgi:hypothetical protein